MLSRVWRIILLIVAGVLLIWPDLFTGARWIALIAVIILLIGELACKNCHSGASVSAKKPSRKRRR